MKIQINQHYIYENNLVRVVGSAWKVTRRYMIQWGDSQGRACTAEVDHYELQEAPTMQRLYADYKQALEVICQMANKIEALEESRDLWQAEALRLRTKTDEIPF